MAVRRLIKLPRKYYKRARPLPTVQLATKNKFQIDLIANLTGRGVGGLEGRILGKQQLRGILLEGLATSIVNESRTVHINGTMEEWKLLRAQDQLVGDVAIIVDGSPQRPIKNVKYGGEIRIQKPASLEVIMEATALAYQTLIKVASSLPYGADYNRKKNNTYSYRRSFDIWISDKVQVDSPSDIGRMGLAGTFTEQDWVSIQNWAPYAAKLERKHVPNGAFVSAFKAVRRKYGKLVAVRFDYVEGSTTMSTAGGIATPQPVIRIGQPDAFPSRMANVRKNSRDYVKRGRGPY